MLVHLRLGWQHRPPAYLRYSHLFFLFFFLFAHGLLVSLLINHLLLIFLAMGC